MARKRYKPEEIVAKLRQVDVLVSQGQNMMDAIRQIGVSEVTYYRWRVLTRTVPFVSGDCPVLVGAHPVPKFSRPRPAFTTPTRRRPPSQVACGTAGST